MDNAHAKLPPYATHLPLLTAAVAHTDGPVLELGCGAFSTPLLHALCSDGRPLVSYEADRPWYDQFKSFHRGAHQVLPVDDWDKLPLDFDWAVAFVDHAPAARRAIDIKRLKPWARLIVVHDTEHRLYDLEPVLSTFKHRREWRAYAPWTSVVSDVDDLDWLDDVAKH